MNFIEFILTFLTAFLNHLLHLPHSQLSPRCLCFSSPFLIYISNEPLTGSTDCCCCCPCPDHIQ